MRAEILGHCAVVVVLEPVVMIRVADWRGSVWRVAVEEVFYVEDVDVADLVHRVRLLLCEKDLIV